MNMALGKTSKRANASYTVNPIVVLFGPGEAHESV